jgi:hypothetical protein
VVPGADVLWDIHPAADHLTLALSAQGTAIDRVEGLELVFPFDPRVTPTTVLPSAWAEDGSLHLPAVISAPDFGQMLLANATDAGLRARLEGDRARQTVDLVLEFRALHSGENYQLNLTPVRLPPPPGLRDKALWRLARRGWFNAFQPSAQWGDQYRPFSAPAGILANNVISDPVSGSVWFYADQALWTPEVAPGVSAIAQVRRTVDW